MAEETLTVSAESSPAPETPAAEVDMQERLNSLNEADLAKWQKTGELPGEPTKESEPKEAESAPAEPVKTESAPAPDATKQQEKTQEYNWKALREKAEQAERRARDLEAKLAERESKPGVKTESPTEPTGPQAPKKPAINDFETWEAYEEAKDKYTEDLADFKAKNAVAEFQKQQRAEAEKTAAEERRKADDAAYYKNLRESSKRYADFKDKVYTEDGTAILLPLLQKNDAMSEAIYRSEFVGDLMYALTGNLEEAERIASLDGVSAVREVMKLELSLSGTTSKANPAQPITRAPKPPTVLSAKSTEPEDEAEAALAAGDYGRYERVMNKRERESQRA